MFLARFTRYLARHVAAVRRGQASVWRSKRVFNVWAERELLMMNTAKLAPQTCIAAFVGVPLVLVWSGLEPAPQVTFETDARERNR